MAALVDRVNNKIKSAMCIPAILTGTVLIVTFLTVLGQLDQALAPLSTFMGGIISATVVAPPLISLQQSGIFAILITVVIISILLGRWEGRLIFRRAALSFFGFTLFAGLVSLLNRFDPTSIDSLLVFSDAVVDIMHSFGFDCHFFEEIISR